MEEMKLNISKQLRKTSQRFSSREALYCGGIRKTYKELDEDVSMLAKGLIENGVKPGDHIGVALKNSYEYVTIFFATARVGAVLVPINPMFSEEESKYIMKQSDIVVLFCDGERFYNKLCDKIDNFKFKVSVRFKTSGFIPLEELKHPLENDEIIQVEPKNNLFTIMYTSGTTGRPKGAMLTHSNVLSTTIQAAKLMECTKEDVFLIPSPLFHIFGVTFLLRSVYSGGKIVLMESYSVTNALRLIETEKVTVHPGVPTMFTLELNSDKFHKYDLSSLRTGEIAAAPSPIELIKQIRRDMNCNPLIAYGSTETSATLTITSFTDSDEIRSETVGRSIDGAEIKIINSKGELCDYDEVGELVCRGTGITSGYYKMPEETKEAIDKDGWFYTGDMVTIDEEGYVRIVGRKTDMIIKGGYNIYPTELEETLHEHPDIVDVAVIGLSDELYGEIICACVIKRKNSFINEESLRTFMEERFVKYKLPDRYEFMDELPTTPSGKISKLLLKEIFENDSIQLINNT